MSIKSTKADFTYSIDDSLVGAGDRADHALVLLKATAHREVQGIAMDVGHDRTGFGGRLRCLQVAVSN